MCLQLPPLKLAVKETGAISHWLWVRTVIAYQLCLRPTHDSKKNIWSFPRFPLTDNSILICWFTVLDQHYNHIIAKRWSEHSHTHTHEVQATNRPNWSRLVLRLSNLADQMEFSPFKWLIIISCKHLKFILIVAYFSQLRPCPHLEQDVLSDCLSMQHLQSSTSTQHLYNGKDGHSPALGQDIFTGRHLSSVILIAWFLPLIIDLLINWFLYQ